MPARTFIDILIEQKSLTADSAAVLRRTAKDKNIPLEEVLAKDGGVSEEALLKARAEFYKIPFRQLRGFRVPLEVLKHIPEESARFYKFVPIDQSEGLIEVGMLNPEDSKAREALNFIANRMHIAFKVSIISPTDLESVLKEYQTLGGEVTKAIGQFQKESELKFPSSFSLEKQKKKDVFIDEAPITRMVSVILRHAVEGRASDIHIEPIQDTLRVRFRVDGILYTSLTLPKDVHSAIITRIKVLTNMKIDESRIPQDGRFRAEINGRNIDFRVSTFPTGLGEKVVMRILDSEAGIKTLEAIGLSGRNLDTVKRGLNKPYGIILITGPTGSGKSTTMYAMLQLLNEDGVNIVSLEDPIEYFVEGVNQSQIRPEIGYDFSTGLRSILRQDPDIILVGEIRDKETAGLAVHAALTGHLVISTLHTNNAMGAIPRLIDLGVDPFLISPTLALVVGQRLIPRLCEDSKNAIELTGRSRELIDAEIRKIPDVIRSQVNFQEVKEIYQAKPSNLCPKGTRGRLGIFEVLEGTPSLQKIILEGGAQEKIAEEGVRQNFITIRQDGILKVLEGVIGLEELLEVT
ncbi:MAG: ATPase, T2SS/T4P/T4SS family [Patescibacteria group bacterium]